MILVSTAGIVPEGIPVLSFVLLAPKARIDGPRIFRDSLDPEGIRSTVWQRAHSYDQANEHWLNRYVEPVLQRCSIRAISWEQILQIITSQDGRSGQMLSQFYEACLRYNPIG